ncbi:MAG: TIGR03960 family B12-binding radical SAM protein [Candidatus Omnitrophica bacterium]|nr:TIGR03960 family B12-binding radical SAM protein [Candidatus Omnitrophota bacterium]MDD5690079.1 TIGR03960 family B12-binding radical SAM protein [Candidatus Omnitrophota bacterium]
MIEDLFLGVHRPAQYLGNEWNACKKDFGSCKVSFALGFPDLYEIGMSNLGLRIIYGVLNNIPDVACERFFALEADMEAALKNSNRRLSSWESSQELIRFDMLGFSLGSELNYTNVLGMLELSGLPLQSSLRDCRYPLVIAGGPCALNPEPMAEFFDLFIIGEAEEAIVEVLNLYRKYKDDYRNGKLSKDAFLSELSQIEGVYAPSLYIPEYDSSGQLVAFAPKSVEPGNQSCRKNLPLKIRKRVVNDFNSAFFPCNWMVPYVQTVHDRITLEIMRGCPNRCRFCQARSQYYPLRIRSRENVFLLANQAYLSSGYEELSLAGLSVSDYPGLESLVSGLIASFKDMAVNLSLPSLKAKALLGNVSTLIAKIKKTGLTFAPEAGTQRLRQALAKDFSEDDFFKAIEEAFEAGYQHLKLYFLIGLPGEKEEDLDGIINFAQAASESKRKIKGGGAQINISINPLIPKPHTPLQWLKMESIDAIKEKRNYLRAHCKNKRLKFSFHNFEMGFLEGVLSRGDRKLGAVILAAYRKGARFDAWSSFFSFTKWQEAFLEQGVDPQEYLNEKPASEILPWDFIDIGIDKEDLLEEFNKSIVM